MTPKAAVAHFACADDQDTFLPGQQSHLGSDFQRYLRLFGGHGRPPGDIGRSRADFSVKPDHFQSLDHREISLHGRES